MLVSQLAQILEESPIVSKFVPLLTMFVSMSLSDASELFCHVDVRDINTTIRRLLRKVRGLGMTTKGFPMTVVLILCGS